MENQGERWRERLEAQGWKAESIVLLARLLADMVEKAASGGLPPEGERMLAEQKTPIDWAISYRAAPTFLTGIVKHFDPTITPLPPSDEQRFGAWLRTILDKIDRVFRRLDPLTDAKTGMFSEATMQRSEFQRFMREAQEHVDEMRIEFKAAVDNLTAIVVWGKTMAELLEVAESGDASAVLHVLQLNPQLAGRDGIIRVVQRELKEQNQAFAKDLPKRLGLRPRPPKQAKIGFILSVLWDLGLKRLTYKQIRGFLKTAGVENVHSHQALERYAQRLGLKKYYIEPRG